MEMMKKLPDPPLWLLGFLEATQAVLISLVFVVIPVVIFAFSAQGFELDLATVADLSARGFLMIHAAPFQLSAGDWFHLVPLLLLIIPVLLSARAGARIARGAYPGQLWQALIAFTLTYLGATVALVQTVLSDAGTSVWAGVAVVLITASSFLLGCYGAAGRLSRLLGVDIEARVDAFSQRLKWISAYLFSISRAGIVAAMWLLGLNAVVLAGWLVWNWMDIVNAYQIINPGFSGVLALSLIQLALAPNFLLWSVAFTSGVGFSMGESSVTPWLSPVASTPEVPVLAALPAELSAAWVVSVPICAGILTGWWLIRDGENHLDDWVQLKLSLRPASLAVSTVVLGVVTGLMSAVVLLIPLWLSHISLGLGQWVDIGPHAPAVAFASGGWVGLGVLVGYLVFSLPRATRSRRAKPGSLTDSSAGE